MVDYPRDILSVRMAMLAYIPPEEAAEAVSAALSHPSDAARCVGVFNALKGEIETLDVEGLKVLAGAASLISENQYFGFGAEAYLVRDAAVAALNAA